MKRQSADYDANTGFHDRSIPGTDWEGVMSWFFGLTLFVGYGCLFFAIGYVLLFVAHSVFHPAPTGPSMLERFFSAGITWPAIALSIIPSAVAAFRVLKAGDLDFYFGTFIVTLTLILWFLAIALVGYLY